MKAEKQEIFQLTSTVKASKKAQESSSSDWI